jgi:hypothetical protein
VWARSLFDGLEFALQQHCLYWLSLIGDTALQKLDQFAANSSHIHRMNADLRRQEARQTRVVTGDDMDVVARLKTPPAESVQRSQKAQFVGAR